MYLISAYFDEGTEERIRKYVDAVAQRTGPVMVDNDIPPHMTIAQLAAPATAPARQQRIRQIKMQAGLHAPVTARRPERNLLADALTGSFVTALSERDI